MMNLKVEKKEVITVVQVYRIPGTNTENCNPVK